MWSPRTTSILGGGIAGTVLGGALAHRGHPVTVYERQTKAGAGAFMVLDGQAHQALGKLGVSQAALHAVSHPMPAGFRFHYLPAGGDTAPSHGYRLYPRTGLMAVLTEFARAADTGPETRCSGSLA